MGLGQVALLLLQVGYREPPQLLGQEHLKEGDRHVAARRLLEEAGVAATTGRDFDRARGARTMRFSYAGPESDIVEAVDRMKSWIARSF